MLTKELINNIANDTKMSKRQCGELITTMVDVIASALDRNLDIQLQGLGTLEKRTTKEREVVNPRSGKRTVIPAGEKLSFRPTTNLKEEFKGK